MPTESEKIEALKKKNILLEKELHASLQRESEKDCLLRNSPDILYRTNLEGFVTYISPAVARLCGYTVEEATGMHMANEVYVYPEVRKAFLEALQKYGKVDNFVNQLRHKDGSVWWGAANAHIYYDDDGCIAGVEGVVRDVTLQKWAEEEIIELNRTLDKKIKERTHELKQLNEHLIHSEERSRNHFASVLHDSVAQSIALCIIKVSELKEMESSKELSIIDRYLNQSIREIRSLVFELYPTVLKDFEIDEALEYLIDESNKLYQTKFRYINNIDTPIQLSEASKITLYRAVNELLINIVKHSGQKEAEIKITQNKKSVLLCVSDNGVGFDVTFNNQKGHFGFGLFSLSERLKNMGGSFKIESTPGRGTTVSLKTPLTQLN